MDQSYFKIDPCALIKTAKLIELVYSTHTWFPYTFNLKMSQGPFIRHICNNTPTLRLRMLMILKFLGRNGQSFACKLANFWA